MRRLALVVLAGVVAAACGGGSSDGARRVEFVLVADALELPGYQQLADGFTEATGVDVDLAPVGGSGDLLAKLTTSFAGDAPPEVFLINYRNYGQFAEQGVLRPVGPLLEDSEVVSPDDYAPASVDAFRDPEGELLCAPQNVSSLAVYYNRDRFEAAGLQPPAAGWTWDDLLSTAEALTDDDTYGLGIEASLVRLAPFVWGAGGEVVDDQDAPTRLTLDEGPAREALDWYLDLQLVHGVVPPDREEQSQDLESRFINGGLGMYLDSRRAVPSLRSIDGFTWDVAPLPIGPAGTPISILHADAYCLPSETDAPDEAWRFVEYAISEPGQSTLAASGRIVPSHRGVAASDSFLGSDEPPASNQVFLDAVDHLRYLPTVGAWAQVEREATSILEDVFYGREDREAGIERLVTDTRALFAPGGG